MSDYDYDLPPDRIATTPCERRDASRLMVLDRATQTITHAVFRDLPRWLRRDDCLVLNDSRVAPARFHARRSTGGAVEVLLLEPLTDGRWRVMLRPGKRVKAGERLEVAAGELGFRVEGEPGPDGTRTALPLVESDDGDALWRHGRMPLPPYIVKSREESGMPAESPDDAERYQTVYARDQGSVAAPTAGLHFTPELLSALEQGGVRRARCTLHVGAGTFQPVKAERIEDHPMHSERFSIGAEACDAIRATRAAGGRVVCVGTTSTRTLETLGRRQTDPPEPVALDATDLLIAPGFQFRLTDALITNFHLPRSTLILLVSAFAGREFMLEAYRVAIDEGYRFYSFGDAMLIL